MTQRIEDKLAVVDRLYAYMYALDAGLADDWLDCFASDGVLLYKWALDAPEPAFRVEGRDELERWIKGSMGGERTGLPGAYNHLVANPRVLSLDERRAEVVAYFARLVRVGGGHLSGMTGRLYAQLAREDDGMWRLTELAVVDAIDEATR